MAEVSGGQWTISECVYKLLTTKFPDASGCSGERVMKTDAKFCDR